MSDTMADALAKAEAELLDWATGQKSHWNAMHGAQTGDYVAQYERTATADAAELQKQMAVVSALRMLASPAVLVPAKDET